MRATFPDTGVLRPRFRLTSWDIVVIPLVIVAILLLTIAFQGASQPFNETTPDLTVSLNPANLPSVEAAHESEAIPLPSRRVG
jgi:NitT/TauT family transport system permease protein